MADITERKRVEQAIFEEKERAQVTLQSIGDAVITTDRDGAHRLPQSRGRATLGLERRRGARRRRSMEVLRLRDESDARRKSRTRCCAACARTAS